MPLNIISRLKLSFTNLLLKNLNINPLITRSIAGQKIDAPDSYLRNTMAYHAVSVVGSCVDQIADDFMQLPFIINRVTIKNNEIVRENITLEERFAPFFKPNEHETKAQFIRKFVQQKNIVGEMFLEPVYATRSQPPVKFFLHNPNNMEINIESTGIKSYTERINAQEMVWSPDPTDDKFLVYFCIGDPMVELRGTSPLDQLKSETAMEWHAMRFALAFFKNGARFSNLITFAEAINEDELQRFKLAFKKEFQGSSNAFNTLFLSQDATVNEMGTSQQDMMFIQQLERVDRRICGRYGVPPVMIGLTDSVGLGNDVIQAMEKMYWGGTMVTQASVIDDMYTNYLLPLFKSSPGERLEYVTDFSKVEALQKNRTIESTRLIQEFNNGGMTYGEFVEALGNKTIDDPLIADVRVLPFNLVPATEVLNPPPILLEEPTAEDIADLDDEKYLTTDQIKMGHLSAKGRLDVLLSNQKRTAKFRRISKQREKIEKLFNEVYKKMADQQMKAVIRNLNKVAKAELDPDDVNGVLLKVPVAVEQLKRGFRPTDLKAIDVAEKIVSTEIGMAIEEVKVLSPERKAVIRAREKLYPSIVMDTNNSIRRVLEDGIASDLDIADISKNIQGLFKDKIKKSKADLIARTESVSVVNGGQVESMRSGGIEKKMWLTSRDSDVRDEHVVMDGEIVGIDEEFSNGSQVPDDFNERCTILPIAE